MSGFLNIRNSRLDESCKIVFLTFFQNSLKNIKNIRDAVFNLKFKAKRSITFLKRLQNMCFPKNFVEVLRTPFSQNANMAATSKTFENKHFLLPGFNILANSLKNTCKRFHFCSNTVGYRIIRAVVCVFRLITILLRFSR